MTTEIATQPSHISHYRLIRKLGQGGMSVVYEGFDERLKRTIAIKILHPFLASGDEYKTRFLREAQVVARLAHPNIVQIYDISPPDNAQDQLYIVTEFVSGQTLKDWAEKNSCIEIPEFAALIISQIAQALDHAHQKGIIHRDIKPENIMITDEGHLKLMDFGIASIGSDESLTQVGTLLGSLAHLAPEIINGQKASIASDIYSLSTVFFWLVTRKLPFAGDSPHALLKNIVDKPAEKIQRLSPYVSDGLAHIIERGMHKNPASRFKTVPMLIAAIDHALEEFGVSIEPKKFAHFLASKAPLTDLKDMVLAQIGKRKAYYELHKQEEKILELQCRLDASPQGKNAKKGLPYKSLTGIAALGILSGLAIIFKREHAAPTPVVKQEALEENTLAQEMEQTIENDTQQDEKKEAVVAEPKVEEVKENPKPVSTKPDLQQIDVVIWPFANVSVNGTLVGKNQKSISLKLPIGSHRLSFTHTYAATMEKLVKIDRIGAPVELSIVLTKSKPAFLVVKCSEDANVAINGSFKGSSFHSLEKPIVVPLPDRTHSIREKVLIQRDGFEPVIESVEFIAGQIKMLKVDLKPAAEKIPH